MAFSCQQQQLYLVNKKSYKPIWYVQLVSNKLRTTGFSHHVVFSYQWFLSVDIKLGWHIVGLNKSYSTQASPIVIILGQPHKSLFTTCVL